MTLPLFPGFAGFRYSEVWPCDERVTRRDPSPVIAHGGSYFVWYSLNRAARDGYSASIWYATSADGHYWQEIGEALPKGPSGAFDEHGVFTPTILQAAGRYYLYYTAVPEPFTNDDGGPRGTRTAIGVAVADTPHGPWRRHTGNPILRPSDDPTQFDSMRVDDSCLIARDGAYWMYYKGRQQERSPRETKMGLAIAPTPLGPFVKEAGNPVLDSGHEICVWPHGHGVACLVCQVGPQGNTLQFSDDGRHFRKIADTVPPKAPGPFRADAFREGAGPGITWGIAMIQMPRPHLVRFECDLRAAAPTPPAAG
jgi:hypothetical protein